MDAAFAPAPYGSYTTAQLQGFVRAGKGNPKMEAEIARRASVAAGDVSVMTPSERLRHAAAIEATDATIAYQRGVFDCLARNGQPGAMNREELEITNMCGKLNRPFTNCASLIMRIRSKVTA